MIEINENYDLIFGAINILESNRLKHQSVKAYIIEQSEIEEFKIPLERLDSYLEESENFIKQLNESYLDKSYIIQDVKLSPNQINNINEKNEIINFYENEIKDYKDLALSKLFSKMFFEKNFLLDRNNNYYYNEPIIKIVENKNLQEIKINQYLIECAENFSNPEKQQKYKPERFTKLELYKDNYSNFSDPLKSPIYLLKTL